MDIYVYFVLFVLFIGEQCSSASLGHDDIDIVNTEAKSETREVEGRVITGDSCEYIMLCDIIKNAGCDDGSKFVVKQKTGVRKQFLILNGSPVLAFVKKKTKFTSCTSYTQVTSNVDCKAVSGLSSVDLSSSSFFRSMFKDIMEEFEEIEIIEDIPVAQPRAAGRVIKGDDCEYIKICDVTNNNGCSDGNKFVIQQKSGVRKQFLILNGDPVVGFVTKKKKFTSCTSYTEVTSNVDCKEVSGLADVDFSSSSNSSTSTSSPSNSGGCKCGVKKTDRIVGGKETEVNEYPWMAAVADAKEKFFCGGTLVASMWVVTASHCMFNDQKGTEPKAPVDLRIVLGDHDKTDTTESILPRIVVEVAQIIKHPAYDATTTDNDITLLKLSTAVDLNIYTPACMANSGDDFTDKKAWTYGWGALSYGTGDYPDKLLEVAVTIVSTATCQAALNDLDWTITDGMLCAGGVEGEDTCQGDSGGPLTVDVAGQHTLVGDVSFGHECARANFYGIYAKTSFYREWIDTTVAAEGGATYCPA